MSEISEKELERYKAIERDAADLLDDTFRHKCGHDYTDARNRLRKSLEPVSRRPTSEELHTLYNGSVTVVDDMGATAAHLLDALLEETKGLVKVHPVRMIISQWRDKYRKGE